MTNRYAIKINGRFVSDMDGKTIELNLDESQAINFHGDDINHPSAQQDLGIVSRYFNAKAEFVKIG